MAGEVEELRDGQRPHGKGRGEGAERGVLGAPVDAELRQGLASQSETERRARRSWKREHQRAGKKQKKYVHCEYSQITPMANKNLWAIWASATHELG
jgi:hypothetical protein